MLNFESSHQSIFHGVLPVSIGLSLVHDSEQPENTMTEDASDSSSFMETDKVPNSINN